MNHPFKGLGVAMITPFDVNLNVDFKALDKLLNLHIEQKTDYLVVMGTTAESATLSSLEKRKILNYVLEKTDKKIAVVYGAGGNDTNKIVQDIKEIKDLPLAGLLSVSPYYNKPTQEGIFRHYQTICEATEFPVILYNVPGRTASNMLPETTLRIAESCKNCILIKEASGNLSQMMEIIRNKPEGFELTSGDDSLTLPVLSIGGIGVISVLGNALPAEMMSLMNAFFMGDIKGARKIHYALFPLMEMIFEEGNPAGIKNLLHQLGLSAENLRLPLIPVSSKLSAKMLDALKRI